MNSKTSTIGLDLGDRRHHACVLDEAGEIVRHIARRNGRLFGVRAEGRGLNTSGLDS